MKNVRLRSVDLVEPSLGSDPIREVFVTKDLIFC